MRIMVSGGGTGGHIYPALALIRGLKAKYPNLKVLYIGTEKGLESTIVPKENIPFKTIEISGFKRSLSFENVKTIGRFITAYMQSKRYIKEFKPDVVIGTGGYVSGPVLFAATRCKIPTIVHEQNSVPGITNVFLSKFVSKVGISFNESAHYFPSHKVIFTGNPRASEVIEISSEHVKEFFGLTPSKKLVLVVGGSRGARPINDAMISFIKKDQPIPYELMYITGEVHYEKVREMLADVRIPKGFKLVPYVSNMQELLTITDVIVNRAGATTLAEITALGIPSILIPSPYVTNNHQEKNARILEENGAAKVLLEQELTGESLEGNINALLKNEDQLREMSEASFALGIRDSVDRFEQVILDLTKKHQE